MKEVSDVQVRCRMRTDGGNQRLACCNFDTNSTIASEDRGSKGAARETKKMDHLCVIEKMRETEGDMGR